MTVTDEDAHLLLPQAQSSTAEEGRGLAIIATLADRWGVEQNDGRKSVWFDLSG